MGSPSIPEGRELKSLVTKRDHGADATYTLAKVPKGGGVPEHVQEGQWGMPAIREGEDMGGWRGSLRAWEG